MAKSKTEKNDLGQTKSESAQVEVLAEQHDAAEQKRPLADIAMLCAKVGEGASVQELRESLPGLFPKEKEEAIAFLSQVLRMKQAMEVAHTIATEIALGIK